MIVNKRGGAGGAPHPLPYQFYIKQIIKIYGKTNEKYIKILKHIKIYKNMVRCRGPFTNSTLWSWGVCIVCARVPCGPEECALCVLVGGECLKKMHEKN